MITVSRRAGLAVHLVKPIEDSALAKLMAAAPSS
jgi:hypothetical protein